MSRKMNRLAVYCGSASPDDPRYIQLAYDVGKASQHAASASSMAAGGSA